MGELEVEGMQRAELLQALLSNDLDKLDVGRAQYTLLTNERGGIVDDLIVYRLDEFRWLLIVNASNREADFAWIKEREIRGSDVRDVSDEYALLAVQGPRVARAARPAGREPFTCAMGEIDGVEVMVNRTGYTGEHGVELMCPADDAPALWDAVVARGAMPCGLGARDTLRLEVCYPLHGNDITPDTDAISAGLGWTCALDTEFTGADELRRIKERGAGAEARRVRDGRRGRSRARGWRSRRRRGHLRDALADARRRHRHGLRPRGAGRAGHGAHDRRARPAARRARRQETDLQTRGALEWRHRVATPTTCKYHRRARLGAHRGRRGDARHHLVRAGRARRARPLRAAGRGRDVAKDESYGEVESVKAVSDVIAPLSGEVLEVNQEVVDAPETVNEDPYGEGWLVRIRLGDPSEVDVAARRRRVQEVLAEQ